MKRFIDAVFASLLALCLLPLAPIVAFLVWLDVGRPVLFRQNRPGLEGRSFVLYKFRTMRNSIGSDGRLLEDADQKTMFGAFLRRTSLDELPQLYHVIRGDMSLVGPRPLLTRHLEKYSARQGHRHDVRPGLTGWAQVNGRNTRTWEEKVELDLWYVENQSLLLDFKILWLTIWAILKREGIDQLGHATAEEFQRTRSTDQPE